MKSKEPKSKINERLIYIGIIIGLVLYGLWQTDNAVKLIESVKNAFSILF